MILPCKTVHNPSLDCFSGRAILNLTKIQISARVSFGFLLKETSAVPGSRKLSMKAAEGSRAAGTFAEWPIHLAFSSSSISPKSDPKHTKADGSSVSLPLTTWSW